MNRKPGYDASLSYAGEQFGSDTDVTTSTRGDIMPRGDQEALKAAYEVPLDEQLDIAEANLAHYQAKVEKLREKLGISQAMAEVATKDIYPGWD